MKLHSKDYKAYAALSVAMLFWASSFIVFKISFRFYNPFFIIWGRMLTASVVFLFFIKKLSHEKIYKSDIKYLLLIGIFEPGIYFIFELLALMNTDAAQAGMITSLNPLLVAIASYFILKEDIGISTIAGMIIASAGVILLSITGEPSAYSPNPLLGNFFEFIAMIAASFYTIILKKLSSRYSTLFLTAIQSFTGLVFFSPFLLIHDVFPVKFSAPGIFSIIYLGVFISGIAYGCYNYAVAEIPANKAAATVNMIPVICLVMAVTVLGEKFNRLQIASSFIVVAGVYISQYRKKILPEF
ncbi:MAG: DMT family transporter [Spirochaetes bacterium]|nr:DMT family transporter [Spirochaetota bacterium]